MNEPVLILTYYWPPSGGSGVQRWMYFAKYLPANGFDPYVVTVNSEQASYKFVDESFNDHVKHVHVTRTRTREVLKLYSKLTTGKNNEGIPQGFAGETKPGLFKKAARYIRGNFFIPDARKGWNKFAFEAACKLIEEFKIKKIITTGPPHSTHLTGLKLKEKYALKWIADFRDPWRELYYNKLLYRSQRADNIDASLEAQVLKKADLILTIGPGMQKLLASKLEDGSKVKFIYNGFDQDMFTKIEHRPLSNNKISIVHIGILGESQPIEAFLLALQQLQKDNTGIAKKIRLKFIGKVSEIIQHSIKQLTPWLEVEFVDYVPHQTAVQEMVNAHLLFNSLSAATAGSYLISGKLMEYLASGRPIMVLGDANGDAAQLVNQFEHCHVFSRNDIKGIELYLKEILQKIDSGDYCSHSTNELPFSRKNTANSLATMLKDI